jgi:hypothetical protein
MSLRAGYSFKPPEALTNVKLAALVASATLGKLVFGNFVERLVDGANDQAGFRTTDTAAAGDHDHSSDPLDGAVINTNSITEEKLLEPVPLSQGGVGGNTATLTGLLVVVADPTTGKLKLASVPVSMDDSGPLSVDLHSPFFMRVG